METTVKITTISSRELNRDIGRAKKAAKAGPVVIIDHGRPCFVLITYDEFERLSGKHRNLVIALAMPGISAIDVDANRMEIGPREVDLS
ncbi:type II toxin-antitoxin system Phd/YefM family antitoxin [Sinorhizobium fredii]|uniref:Antitoxin n=1 Tax=Rhizobium fredii TaxID=380 RepID=A0A2A6LP61_RHIFR|nr:type II toxin-antitoxin system Phd/YefM family antitoxin [Sinorhizobium fredii]PDT44351.1 type II toxin-antitoxin system Phd/YefM family antitoxin [Sinorhizobium fredii]